jgi:NADH:ubiquinone oxidoreductase subunit 5 (subunit L)/multisubunit Na+/H+ antiporter MnhA subunit
MSKRCFHTTSTVEEDMLDVGFLLIIYIMVGVSSFLYGFNILQVFFSLFVGKVSPKTNLKKRDVEVQELMNSAAEPLLVSLCDTLTYHRI